MKHGIALVFYLYSEVPPIGMAGCPIPSYWIYRCSYCSFLPVGWLEVLSCFKVAQVWDFRFSVPTAPPLGWWVSTLANRSNARHRSNIWPKVERSERLNFFSKNWNQRSCPLPRSLKRSNVGVLLSTKSFAVMVNNCCTVQRPATTAQGSKVTKFQRSSLRHQSLSI